MIQIFSTLMQFSYFKFPWYFFIELGCLGIFRFIWTQFKFNANSFSERKIESPVVSCCLLIISHSGMLVIQRQAKGKKCTLWLLKRLMKKRKRHLFIAGKVEKNHLIVLLNQELVASFTGSCLFTEVLAFKGINQCSCNCSIAWSHKILISNPAQGSQHRFWNLLFFSINTLLIGSLLARYREKLAYKFYCI